MNNPFLPQPDDPQYLDRLVDGELSERQRRELLAQLDQRPDGWRRLALSFLESQCWQETAREFDESDLAERPSAPPAQVASPRARSGGNADRSAKPWMSAPLAMAASFFVAFALGIVLRGAWQQGGARPAASGASDRAFAEALEARRAQATAAADARAHSLPATAPAADVAAVENPLPADDAAEIWLPVDLTNTEGDLELNPGPAVPQRVLDSLRRLGHRVETHRSLWPVELKNGKRALVPVDEVEIRYVGGEYQ